ncbi:hypothetical protein C5Y96_21345 [Blastopirellula marina]|uniref:Uncharacterized protein n=1 Tax=Blastopirellula marina TaxID=124 RepID=A0A2S8F1I0_9BACT|nr:MULTISPECIES: hypothetical protein [Pirellulaceae]PQO25999.1 hypothetical protein C5Y96_21345 [Blastopirellula marina]RCS44357.1 hypothetical protein DTL36_21390 [Bremerella cremea]
MSYDIAVWDLPRTFSRQEANQAWSEMFDGDDTSELLEDSPKIDAFQRELEEKYPQLDTLPDDQLDASPWSCEFGPEGPTLTLSYAWSRAEEIAHVVFDLAMKHNLAVFDFNSELIYMPPGLMTPTDCTLESPHLLKTIPAYPEIIPDILDILVGRQNPYLIVDRGNEFYIQTMWTEEGYLLEYRSGSEAEHYESPQPLKAAEVARIIQGYLTHSSWQDGCTFERVML